MTAPRPAQMPEMPVVAWRRRDLAPTGLWNYSSVFTRQNPALGPQEDEALVRQSDAETRISALTAALDEARADAERMRVALEGLWARHNDGSEEAHWAEWDTASEALGHPLWQWLSPDGWIDTEERMVPDLKRFGYQVRDARAALLAAGEQG